MKPSASTLTARVDIAEYEFSLVLEQVLMVTRRAHLKRVIKRDLDLIQSIREAIDACIIDYQEAG